MSAPDFNFDAQNPGQLRKDFIKKFEASGVKADSAMIDEIVNPIIESLGSMIFEFTPNGKLISSESSGGKIKKEEEDYTVNYDKGTIDSKSTHSVQHMKFSFDKEHLILVIVEDNKEGKITLKKIQ